MEEPKPAVHFVSLGCPKNRVDTEVMVGASESLGLRIVGNPAEAEIIVVNTCGFIEEAKEESIDAILDMARWKTDGVCRRLVVVGCLAQRYSEELALEIPEIDKILGSGDVGRVADALVLDPAHEAQRVEVAAIPGYVQEPGTKRHLSGPIHSTYVKIAEGCDRPCAFCIIPKLRGPLRSRSPEDIEREVAGLVGQGAREINLVAQDVTQYGQDSGNLGLAMLVRRIARVSGLGWARIHYAYPTDVTDALIEVMAGEPTIVKYLDVPFQHIDDDVLKKMRRGHSRRTIENLVLRLRAKGIVIRTTFLVGHPGETDAAFQCLHDFVAEAKLDHVGVFTYSREEGTVSALLPGRVPVKIARERRAALLELQQGVSREKLSRMVGKELDVLVDGVSDESEYLLMGRWAGQAPDVDGVIYLADGRARAGDFVRARVTDFADYDLAASILP